jgi:hypothetical protein
VKNFFVWKGVLLGLAFFVVGGFLWINHIFGPSVSGKATGLSVVRYAKIGVLWYWIFGFVLSVVVGCTITKMWAR